MVSPSGILVSKELAASLAVEGKARGVDVHAVHPSPAAGQCKLSALNGGPLGPFLDLADLVQFWSCSRLFDAQLIRNAAMPQCLKPCKGKLPLHFWWWQWCKGAQNEHEPWLHRILKAVGQFQQPAIFAGACEISRPDTFRFRLLKSLSSMISARVCMFDHVCLQHCNFDFPSCRELNCTTFGLFSLRVQDSWVPKFIHREMVILLSTCINIDIDVLIARSH